MKKKMSIHFMCFAGSIHSILDEGVLNGEMYLLENDNNLQSLYLDLP